jgi:hypothetical protein
LTGVVFSYFGDFICQKAIEKSEFSHKRSKVFCSYGLVEAVIGGHFWLNFLERSFGTKRTLKNALVKTTADVGLFAPFDLLLFMTWTNKLEHSTQSLSEKISKDYSVTYIDSLAFYIPTSVICFYNIPSKYRVPFFCASSLVWDIFMSFATHNSLKKA